MGRWWRCETTLSSLAAGWLFPPDRSKLPAEFSEDKVRFFSDPVLYQHRSNWAMMVCAVRRERLRCMGYTFRAILAGAAAGAVVALF